MHKDLPIVIDEVKPADFGREAMTMALQRLVLVAVVNVRWSKDLGIVLIMLGILCTSGEPL